MRGSHVLTDAAEVVFSPIRNAQEPSATDDADDVIAENIPKPKAKVWHSVANQ
jgi:hypothetical protein